MLSKTVIQRHHANLKRLIRNLTKPVMSHLAVKINLMPSLVLKVRSNTIGERISMMQSLLQAPAWLTAKKVLESASRKMPSFLVLLISLVSLTFTSSFKLSQQATIEMLTKLKDQELQVINPRCCHRKVCFREALSLCTAHYVRNLWADRSPKTNLRKRLPKVWMFH